jgi:hypothetical protein
VNKPLSSARPWHLWLVGLLSLAWNSYAGFDYYMSQTGNAAYLRRMTEPYGVKLEEFLAYMDSYPLWMEVLWALGVWASVAGAVLILLRSRFAAHAFILSLIGLVGSFGWTSANPLPGATDNAVAYALTGMVALLIVLQIVYCRRMAARGVLG